MTLTQKKAQEYILKSINSEDYAIETKTEAEKIKFLFDTFKSEYGWNIERIGFQNSFKEWLQGLPSAINIVFYNGDILDLAREWGTLETNATESRQNFFINNYWNVLASNAMQLFKKHKLI